MPLINSRGEVLRPEQIATVPPAPDYENPSVWDTIGAAFEQENWIVSSLMYESIPDDFDPEFKLGEALEKAAATEPAYYQYEEEFIEKAGSQRAFDALRKKIDRELDNRRTLEESGMLGFVSNMAAGMLDPLTFVIGGKAIMAATKMGNVAKGATRGAMAATASVGIQEIPLHLTQETRTLEESFYNLAGSAVFGGVLGGAAGLVSPVTGKTGKQIAKQISEDIRPRPEGVPDPMVPHSIDAPKEIFSGETIDGNTLVSALGLEKVTKNLNPLLRTVQAKSLKARVTALNLVENVFILKKHLDPNAPPSRMSVETLAKIESNKQHVKLVEGVDSAYRKYRESHGHSANVVRATFDDYSGNTRKAGILTSKEFSEEVSRVARGGTSDIAEINDAAKIWKDVSDYWYKQAEDVDLFGDDPLLVSFKEETGFAPKHTQVAEMSDDLRGQLTEWIKAKYPKATQDDIDDAISALQYQAKFRKNYLMRMYDGDKITNDRQNFNKVIKAWLRTLKRNENLSSDELDIVAGRITDQILGSPIGRLGYDIEVPITKNPRPGYSTPLNRRKLEIPDDFEVDGIRFSDFLVNDIEVVSRAYNRHMAVDIELNRRFGSVTLEKQLREISDEYNKLAQKPGLSTKQLRAIEKERKKALNDIQGMLERVRGLHGIPADPNSWMVTASRGMRSLNTVTKMGGVVPSSASDIARPIMVHGVTNTVKYGWVPLMKRMKAFGKASPDVRELRMAGVVAEHISNRSSQFFGLTDIGATGNRASRSMHNLTQAFGHINLMNVWNKIQKEVFSMVQSTRTLHAIDDLVAGKISPNNHKFLRAMDIDDAMARRIHSQMQKYGKNNDGLPLPEMYLWDDINAERAFRGSVAKGTEAGIVTPGAGDLPFLVTKTEAGKMLGQFRSFFFASINRMIIPGMQMRDANFIIGTMGAVMMGMQSSVFYNYSKGNEDFFDELTPTKLVLEGWDRSGIASPFFEVNNIVERITGGRLGISAMLGEEPMSRYTSRNAVDALFGPSMGTLKDMADLGGAALSGEWTKGDNSAMHRIRPFQNLFYLNFLNNWAKDYTAELLGVQ